MEFLAGKIPVSRLLSGIAGQSGNTPCEIQPGCRLSAAPINYGSRLESLKEGIRNFTMRLNGN